MYTTVKDLILRVSFSSCFHNICLGFLAPFFVCADFGVVFWIAGMLFDLKGSSVGVMVCGPKNMRHEIATICSSGLADNLHFESISFSW